MPDNVDPDRIAALLDAIDLDNTVFNVITKSGGTAETMSEFLVFRDALIRKLGPERHVEHIVITTDPEKGELREIVKQFGYASLPIPPDVGGRFSVLSAVGLLSAAVTGIDIHKLLRGRGGDGRALQEIEEAVGEPGADGRGVALPDGQGEGEEHPGDDAVLARVAGRGGLVPPTLGGEPRQTHGSRGQDWRTRARRPRRRSA